MTIRLVGMTLMLFIHRFQKWKRLLTALGDYVLFLYREVWHFYTSNCVATGSIFYVFYLFF